jgi:hypothetical protein
MKKILLVTLDLSGSSENNKRVFEALKKQGRWWHYMKPTWLIYTDKTPDQIVDNIKPYVAGHGRMLVTELTKPRQGLLPKDAWDWIHKRENGD